MTFPLAFLSLVAEMHLVFASAEGEEGERERRRREEGGERGREEGGEGEDSLAVCWRLNRMLSHRGESSAVCVSGSKSTHDPEKGLVPQTYGRSDSRPKQGQPLAPPWLFYSRYALARLIRPCRRFSVLLRRETAPPGRGRSGRR